MHFNTMPKGRDRFNFKGIMPSISLVQTNIPEFRDTIDQLGPLKLSSSPPEAWPAADGLQAGCKYPRPHGFQGSPSGLSAIC